MAAIDRVFTEQALARVRNRQSILSAQQCLAYETLTAHGPPPSEPDRALMLKRLRASRAAWEAYLDTADACGLLDDEMIGSLQGFKEDQFRGAMGEARACWYFAGVSGHRVAPRPAGRNGKVLDMLVKTTMVDLHVEVKSPFIGGPNEEHKTKDLLVSKVANANTKFETGRCNVLALTPDFSWSLYSNRMPLLRAFIGQPGYVIPVAPDSKTPTPKAYGAFKVDGRLTRTQRQGDFEEPLFKRVSAIVTIEERYDERTPEIFDPAADIEVKPEVLVLHNPHALVAMPEGLFGDVPELVRRGDVMFWTDKALPPAPTV